MAIMDNISCINFIWPFKKKNIPKTCGIPMGIVHRMPESNKEINIKNSCRETCLK
jgi:hypothetical protein